ncbi:MAG: hypothetical protein CMP76_00100 [Flavobacterium sp.]|uniref:hypothetical protein n=1 Tax=Flavobacterium sp. TaxID=239 RepID=UPI000C3E942D|nr:hypothetical protein [Flavobacterium sp.]MBF01675.1 hypothetical protein [Flavobacterium sp.]|tara:strand:+ start:1434 stop:1928 length:495 start_codon:yes stop_codon:yes gene_type:complete
MQTFFKRLLHIVEFQGFKNINDFALNGLKYDSSSKLNRLKDEKNKPSVEIILDIANQFPDVNMHWLLTGKGNVLLSQNDTQTTHLQEPTETYVLKNNNPLANNYDTLKETIFLKDELIKTLKEKIEIQEKQFVPIASILEKMENRITSIEQFQSFIKEKLALKE